MPVTSVVKYDVREDILKQHLDQFFVEGWSYEESGDGQSSWWVVTGPSAIPDDIMKDMQKASRPKRKTTFGRRR
ncbi:hypothetical protein LX36DRAFT_660536 [Colletotrichum falcatum]|nr:hypothetical protein LX36DRAFT_660536 [Colletotrichum falcatum]